MYRCVDSFRWEMRNVIDHLAIEQASWLANVDCNLGITSIATLVACVAQEIMMYEIEILGSPIHPPLIC